MEKFIAKLLKDFEDKKLSRRQLAQTIAIAASVYAGGEQAANAAPAKGFKTLTVNHISYTCPDYTLARDFYQHLLNFGVVFDDGRQCRMPFGTSGTHLLPRGTSGAMPPQGYTSSGILNLPPVGGVPNRGGGGAAAAGGQRGAAGANAGRGGGGGNAQRQPVTAHIDHIAYSMKNWDKARVKVILESWGLFPTEDSDSYHVRDPFGYDLQISGPEMVPYSGPAPAAASTNRNGGK